MSEKQQFLDTWGRECLTTLKVLKAYPPAKADLKPHERCRSAKELAWTFVFEGIGGERAFRLLGDKIRKASDAELNQTIKFFTGPKQMADVRRLDFFWFLLMDMVHHRGQLSVYLRMAGGKVPSIYGPSADEPWT